MNEFRNVEEVIGDIKNLVVKKGYLYSLCMILFEDFHAVAEELHTIDAHSRVSTKEASLIIGFLIQNNLKLDRPNTPDDLINMKQETYKLLKELHQSLNKPFLKKITEVFDGGHKTGNYREDLKAFFGTGDMLIEPMFYSGTGVYDIQYLEYLEKKYFYDREWLIQNKQFDVFKTKDILKQIKIILGEKSKKINLISKEIFTKKAEEIKKSSSIEDWEEFTERTIPMMEIYQYRNLFPDITYDGKVNDSLRERGRESFYEGLIQLFVIKKSDFTLNLDLDSFFNNFSLIPSNGFNSKFQGIGFFNEFNARPIIKLNKEDYFIPICFLIFEATYESPFYWMKEGNKLLPRAGENRGKVGEEMVYGFLLQVFGKENIFKSIKVVTKKGSEDTDIDILCILGSKALCIQVKSKKLTELSKIGSDEHLQKDFQGAVQDAYNQGLLSRQKILARDAKFFDNEQEIILSEGIDEVYIMGITTENYSSLAHQSHVMLNKDEEDPFPIFLTMFDLELVVHYLSDPYDFLYYIKETMNNRLYLSYLKYQSIFLKKS